MRTLNKDSIKAIGQEIIVKGWVQTRRDHGGLIFIDLRDHTTILQLVLNPEHVQAFSLGEKLKDEYVVEAKGKVKKRTSELINSKLETGSVELIVEDLKILNTSDTVPIALTGDNRSSEEQRLKYRFLDLRTEKSQTMLKKRAQMYQIMREYMDNNDFTEVPTPILANSSPEGARDFLVPSRVHPGKFYALPQAPQQFKQLLMVGGLSRYYQIAACFRDEDPRSDRLYGDFYQLDLEISFIEDGDEIRALTEPLIIDLVTKFGQKKLITSKIPRISYKDAIEKYGTDKPDLRFEMELIDLSAEFTNSNFDVFKKAILGGGVVKAIKVDGGAKLSRSQIDKFTEILKDEGAKGLAYISLQDNSLKSPILKFLSSNEQQQLLKLTNMKNNDLLFFGADTREIVNKTLGVLRDKVADEIGLKDPNICALAWIIDFPLYEWSKEKNGLDFGHNPFSMPKGGLDALNTKNKLDIIADQFDMVLNGYEICSGAVRNHHPEIMYKVFSAIGYQAEYVDNKFGAMLNAFKYGAPPHGGCAFGIDRIFMVITGEDNIREVIAFPKNGSGVDLMMNSPSEVESDQLKELNIRVNRL